MFGESLINDAQLVIRPDDSWSDIGQRLEQLQGQGPFNGFGDVVTSGHGDIANMSHGKITLDALKSTIDPVTKAPNGPGSSFIRALGSSMEPGSTIRLQHCNLAAGPAGQEFLQLWANLSNRTVVGWDDWYAGVPHGQEWIATPGGGSPTAGKLYPPYQGSKEQQKAGNDGFKIVPAEAKPNPGGYIIN